MYDGLVDKAFVLGIESYERHRSQIRALEDSASLEAMGWDETIY